MNPAPTLSPEQQERLPLFPLPGAVFFPHSLLPLHIFEPRYREMTAWCIENESPLAVARILPGHESEQPGDPPVVPVCGAGRLLYHEELPDGRYILFLQGIGRVRIEAENPRAAAFRTARVQLLDDFYPGLPAGLEAKAARLKTCLAGLILRWPGASRVLDPLLGRTEHPAVLADCLATFLFQDPDARQALLECLDVGQRLDRVRDRITEILTRTAPAEGTVQ